MADVLLIDGHPDRDSLTRALCDAYQEGAAEHAHVARLDLRALSFDPILRRGYSAAQALEPDLARAAEAIADARHVAWFFPTWWNAPPALVKGFIDRVLSPGFAFRYEAGSSLPRKLLRGRSARLVTSMDSPWWWHLLAQRSAVHTQFLRSTLGFVGFAPRAATTIYRARELTSAERQHWLAALRKLGAKDAVRAVRARPAASRATLPAPPLGPA